MKCKLNKKGFTIVEIIVVTAVIVSAFIAILGFFVFDSKTTERSRMRLKAISLAEESIEAVRNFRDNTIWADTGVGVLTPDFDYHPVGSDSGWTIISGNETINGFLRKIVFKKVSRDANDNIESSYNPGNDDSSTRKVIVTINWSDLRGSTSEIITTYITNWRE